MSRSNSHRFNNHRGNGYRFNSQCFTGYRFASGHFTGQNFAGHGFNGHSSCGQNSNSRSASSDGFNGCSSSGHTSSDRNPSDHNPSDYSLTSPGSKQRGGNRLAGNKPCADGRDQRSVIAQASLRSGREGDGQGCWDGTSPPATVALPSPIPTSRPTPMQRPTQTVTPTQMVMPMQTVTPMQLVRQALAYFEQHAGERISIASIAAALEVREPDLEASFDQVRGMTPAQALLEHRLNRLFQLLTEQPRLGLKRAVQACGLAETPDVVPLFEQTFGIEMMLFLLTCRRAAEDRLFRRLHPEAEALVLPS